MSRLDEFVWYHINGDADANGAVLKRYADNNNLDQQSRFDLCYFFSLTYSIPSAVNLLNSRALIKLNPVRYGNHIKKKLIFQSDRRYVAYRDIFERCLKFWSYSLSHSAAEVHEKLISTGAKQLDISKAIPYIEGWTSFGRYAAFLFLETYEVLMDLNPCGTVDNVEYEDGRVFSAGIVHVFGNDELAEHVEHDETLPISCKELDKMFAQILEAVSKAGGDASVFSVETSLCAYRKFFKQTRYNGYYADRQLGEIIKMLPNLHALDAAAIATARAAALPRQYLGEISGWKGIRKDLKHYYMCNGRINGCPI